MDDSRRRRSSAEPLSRRLFVAGLGASAAAVAGPALIRADGAHAAAPGTGGALPDDLFSLGVASGDPLPDGVVLWTRLAPDPLAGGGLPPRAYPVEWEVAEDERFSRVVRRGREVALAQFGHSVHVEVDGLRPGADYVYRFRAGGRISPVGRTRTAPAGATSALRFAFASCQNWQDGYFTAYEALAAEDLDFVAFLGDYIYESEPRTTTVRTHEGSGEPTTLEEYRNRHAQYKSDVHLQAVHAAFPWIVTWDDHEVDNNWADEIPQDPDKQSPAQFRARREAAFQAYYEHMPLRRRSRPRGLDMQLYRRLGFGDLVDLHVLDTRQYRSDQPSTLEAAETDTSLTMTGDEQERWLVDGLTDGSTRWNLLANQVMWAQNDRRAGPEDVFDFDNWDGYRVQRRRMLELFGTDQVSNPVVLTGDRHCTWVCDLEPDFDDPSAAAVGAEITGTSISSGGNSDPDRFQATYRPIAAESPHWKYFDNQRGYMVCDVDRDRMLSSLRLVDTVWQPEGATVRTAAEFVVEAGVPGVTVEYEEPRAVHRRAQTRREAGPQYEVDDVEEHVDLGR
ncbi:alkaline phosphatase D [Haloactinopolyspora alba]|uniref:Alkaline phosphatase D n=1 Tax=Haloactinopolyspora alba TaxID=648780 RepID=A0A2P8DWN2_9ACTN|nr:alkaline phosphatase D family protein [Haloactinopolyspora alba]PSL01612.1 alkaline phosphatase D [Haloactinopolyspora alba]